MKLSKQQRTSSWLCKPKIDNKSTSNDHISTSQIQLSLPSTSKQNWAYHHLPPFHAMTLGLNNFRPKKHHMLVPAPGHISPIEIYPMIPVTVVRRLFDACEVVRCHSDMIRLGRGKYRENAGKMLGIWENILSTVYPIHDLYYHIGRSCLNHHVCWWKLQ